MIPGVVALGRAMAVGTFTETVEAGEQVETVNPATLEIAAAVDAVYVGSARVKMAGNLQPNERVRVSQTADVNNAVISFPVDAPVAAGMTVVVTASAVDSELAGMRFRLVGEATHGAVTARRFAAEVLHG